MCFRYCFGAAFILPLDWISTQCTSKLNDFQNTTIMNHFIQNRTLANTVSMPVKCQNNFCFRKCLLRMFWIFKMVFSDVFLSEEKSRYHWLFLSYLLELQTLWFARITASLVNVSLRWKLLGGFAKCYELKDLPTCEVRLSFNSCDTHTHMYIQGISKITIGPRIAILKDFSNSL